MNKERLEEILDDIENEPELELFFKRLFTDKNYHKLFFLQKEELFSTENGNSLKYLFWNNLEINTENATSILLNQAELKSIRVKQDRKSIAGFYTEGLEYPLKDLVMYIVIKYVRTNPEVKKLINEEKFDYSLMKQSLKDYSMLDSGIFDEINKITTDAKVDDPDLTKLVLSLIGLLKTGADNLAKQIGYFLPSIAENMPEIFFQIHANYQNHLKNLLKSSNLSRQEYLSILNDIYSQKNIFNVHSMFWCSNCLDENMVFNSDSSLHPSQLHLQCPRCFKEMLASSIYELDGRITECIMDQDGLIKTAIAWLLFENTIEFDTIQDEQFEYDFVCKIPNNNLLIECRLHKSQSDEKTIEELVKKDLKQLLQHYSKIKDSHQIKYPIVVTNVDVNKHMDVIKKIKSEFPQELIYANIMALPEVITKIKQ